MDLVVRHCAYCLQTMSNVLVCGQCLKRAYCSSKCQIADWNFQENGQGHQNWCHLNCGEEDLDWEVSTIPGKGLGLIAKRMILAYERIIVDGCRSMDHPSINDLKPVGASLQEIFKARRFEIVGRGPALCLQIVRVNHSCNPNAQHVYEKTFGVVILFAHSIIQAGEEITIDYRLYDANCRNMSAEEARTKLNTNWGIICPKTCVCYDEERNKIIGRSRELDVNIRVFGTEGNPRTLELVAELLENYKILNSGFHDKVRTLYTGLQLATREKKFELALTYSTELYALESVIFPPESDEVKRMSTIVNRLSVDPLRVLYDWPF